VALCVARRALEAYHGTSFEPALRSAFHKLTAELHDELSFSWSDLDEAFSFRTVGLQSVAELEVFETVKNAVVRQQEISFRYRKPREQDISTRTVRPLHLRFQESGCYLFCHDLARRGKVRRFHLGRMSEVQLTGKSFEMKQPFDIDAHLRNSIGIYGAEASERIHLRFSAQVTPLVGERSWHRTQQLELREDGSADFTMEVAVTPELERWVLGWGADVEVIAPIPLRQKMAEVGRVLASRE
jgi:proteasome accessory factor B